MHLDSQKQVDSQKPQDFLSGSFLSILMHCLQKTALFFLAGGGAGGEKNSLRDLRICAKDGGWRMVIES